MGGVPVTSITGPDDLNGAFQSKGLTFVTIPNSVTTIGDGAFSDNQLTTLTIPDSVTSVDSFAFLRNNLISLTIPSSITTIGDYAFSDNQLTSVTIQGNPTLGSGVFASNGNQAALNSCYDTYYALSTAAGQATLFSCIQSNLIYVQIYAPNAAADNTSLQSTTATGVLYNYTSADGGTNYVVSCPVGGQLLNPAQLQVQYRSLNGSTLRPTALFVGQGLSDYSVAANPTGDVSLYYTAGQTISYQPPAIAGYVTPTPYPLTLQAGTNNDPTNPANGLTALYHPLDSNNSGSDSGSLPTGTLIPGAPNTAATTLPAGCTQEAFGIVY